MIWLLAIALAAPTVHLLDDDPAYGLDTAAGRAALTAACRRKGGKDCDATALLDADAAWAVLPPGSHTLLAMNGAAAVTQPANAWLVLRPRPRRRKARRVPPRWVWRLSASDTRLDPSPTQSWTVDARTGEIMSYEQASVFNCY